MLYTVTCYKETGFSRGNIPSSPAVIQNAASVTLQANQVWKMQDLFLSKVKLAMNWENASKVDYMKIGDKYYTVEGIEMVSGSDNVAEFTIALDPINSVGGVNGFTLIDGWVKRCSPKSDGLFDNILPEPWTPANELKMDGPVSMTASTYEGVLNSYIVSTIDIKDTEHVAIAYKSADPSEDNVFPVSVPQVKGLSVDTMTDVYLCKEEDTPEGWRLWHFKLPGSTMYVTANVIEDIAVARSLGLMDAITASFSIPTMYAIPTSGPIGNISKIEGQIIEYDAESLPYKYGTYTPKNNKVYALYNIYRIRSAVGGNTGLFEGRELYSGGQYPGFWIYADPSPDGRPYCQPIWYQGARTVAFQNSISGGQWLKAAIVQSGLNGQLMENTKANRLIEDEGMIQTKLMNNIVNGNSSGIMGENSSGSVLSDVLGAITGPFNKLVGMLRLAEGGSAQDYIAQVGGQEALFSAAEFKRDRDRAIFDFNVSQNIVVPSVYFSEWPEMQYYIGNGFYIDRVRLSENDMERFDNFLTMYGYAEDRKLESNDFTSHQHFNYVQASNVAVKGPSMMLCNMISNYFAGGVRLWHELPNQSAMTNNPIKS